MKAISWLLVCAGIFLFPAECPAQIKFDPSSGAYDFSSAKKIEDAYFPVEGGEIEIKDGAWGFLYKKGSEYGYACRFVIINNSDRPYKVCPAPFLYDSNGFELNAPHDLFKEANPFKARVVAPGEHYVFEETFEVQNTVAVKIHTLSIRLVPDKGE